MNSTFLKIAVASLGLAALTIAPALAKSPRPIRSQVPAAVAMEPPVPFAYASGGPVVDGGRILGTDPDPNVRLELQRDYPTYMGAN
jgi:hypothetical protein